MSYLDDLMRGEQITPTPPANKDMSIGNLNMPVVMVAGLLITWTGFIGEAFYMRYTLGSLVDDISELQEDMEKIRQTTNSHLKEETEKLREDVKTLRGTLSTHISTEAAKGGDFRIELNDVMNQVDHLIGETARLRTEIGRYHANTSSSTNNNNSTK